MDAKSIVSLLIDLNNVKKTDVAKVLGISKYALADRLNSAKSNNLTTNSLNQMLNAIRVAAENCAGYDVYVVPRGSRVPKGSYLVSDGMPTKPVVEDGEEE